MSTLPFLLSVADELDNLNSQSYMDDFGLGFHPHRQYYRTPTIQLSLPASTDWMQNERHRCRIHKFTDDSQQNNLAEGEESEDNVLDTDYGASTSNAATSSTSHQYNQQQNQHHQHHHHDHHHKQHELNQRHKYAKTISQANMDDDNVENTVQMYSLSKKCCKNYYRHVSEPTKGKMAHESVSSSSSCGGGGGGGAAAGGSSGFKLHSKCLEGNNSSSDESLQKVSSSIEFLTCFLVKKSRANKAGSTTSSQAAAAAAKAADLAAASTSSAVSSEGTGSKKS